jgi:excisionase family DNA binding protein
MPKTSVLAAPAASGLVETLKQTNRALVVREVAEMFRVTCGTVYRLARNNAIPNFRFGGTVLFDPQALARWVGAQ